MSNHKSINELESVYWGYLLAGNRQGLFELYNLYYRYLFDAGMFVTPDTALVEDCIQSLFVRLWEKRATLGTAHHVRSYLLSSFKRSLVLALRQQEKHTFVDLEKVESAGLYREDSIEDLLIRNQERSSRLEQLSQALQQLSPRQREFIYLRYYRGLSYEAIAAQTQTSVRTVYNQVNLAIQALRKDKNLRFDKGDLFLVLLSSFTPGFL